MSATERAPQTLFQTENLTMTLQQYSDRNGITINRHDNGGTFLIMPAHNVWRSGVLDNNRPQVRHLWRLTDYAVSTISGPIVWMAPRQ